jgi:arylsulfatase
MPAMRAGVLVAALTVAGWFAGTGANQTRPDFSGRWTAETAAASGDVRGDMGSGWAPAITIAQDGARLTIEHATFTRYDMQPPVRFTYALDGSETRNTVMMGRGTQVQTSRVAWVGQALKITTLFTDPDPTSGLPPATEVVHTLTLESPASLVVDVSRGASTTRTVYRRSKSE